MSQTFKIKELCSTCGGTGIQPGDLPEEPGITCFMCAGTGSRETGSFIPDVELATQQIVAGTANAISDVIRSEIAAHDTTVKDLINTALNKLDQIKSKCDNIKDKCDNIKDKCDQIWDKVK
jgi:hypothetical protein